MGKVMDVNRLAPLVATSDHGNHECAVDQTSKRVKTLAMAGLVVRQARTVGADGRRIANGRPLSAVAVHPLAETRHRGGRTPVHDRAWA